MRIQPTLCVVALAALLSATATYVSEADTKTACLAAHERGQPLRGDGKLRAARDAFVQCAAEECPALLREECSKAVAEVAAVMPTVVFAVRDPDGNDLTDIVVRMDGDLLTEELGAGKAFDVDPGEHVFEFESPSGQTEQRTVVVRIGEKNRSIEVALGKRRSVAPTQVPESPRPFPTKTVGYVVGGVGVLGLGSFAIFGLKGRSQESSLDDCKPHCSQEDYDAMKRSYRISDISLAVGLVGVGAGVVLVLLSKDAPEQAESAWVGVRPSQGGSLLELGTRF